ncbi:MAG: hypothetical protein H6573_32700 [Lewinellaceae bacterium]|nr:hypothetical protein [Lewinellaceae bacterium]
MHRLTEIMQMSREEQVKDFLHTYTELARVAEDKAFLSTPLKPATLP